MTQPKQLSIIITWGIAKKRQSITPLGRIGFLTGHLSIMATINLKKREVECKIVYYGPGRCGKTTNLEYVFKNSRRLMTDEMVSVKTKGDLTIFFDFVPMDAGKIKGCDVRFQLYTVPGQVYYASSRKVILNGVDGIVFVADSQPHRMEANIETLLDLESNLKQDGHTLENFPWVIQYNKRDLPGVEAVEVLQKRLNFFDVPSFEGSAVKGEGVFNTLKAVINNVVQNVQSQL